MSSKAQEEHKRLVASGMFWEFYPALSGQWEEDKDEWLEIYEELTKLRNEKN